MQILDEILIKVFIPLLVASVTAVAAVLWRTINSVTRSHILQEEQTRRLIKAEQQIDTIREDTVKNDSSIKLLKQELTYIKTGIDEIKAQIRDLNSGRLQ